MRNMNNNYFENLRYHYKPNNIEILFVGESRPQGGTFFYQEDSSLYRETKKAFNKYFSQDIFSLGKFKLWGCWLYDICENPVNHLSNNERRHIIYENIPRLENFIKQESPKIIIVCKKILVEPVIRESSIMNIYQPGNNIFFLPFPGYGNQRKYREELINVLKVYGLGENIINKQK